MPHSIMCRLGLFVVLYLLAIQPIQSQKAQSVTISVPNQELNNLFQGRTYFPNYVKIVGSQYLTEKWRIGKLTLMDKVYSDLPIWYDTYTDDLILIDWQGSGYGRIKLNKEHIESFEFDNRRFINPSYSPFKSYGLEDKFHEVLTEGMVSFLINRKTSILQEESIQKFDRKDSKILLHSGNIFHFHNKKSFIKAVPPNIKSDIVKHIKQQKLRLKKADDTIWNELIIHINNLLEKQRVKDL